MRYKLRRQSRYKKLRNAGFTINESKEFSTRPLTTIPYMRVLIRMRVAQVEEWQSQGFKTWQDLHRKIMEFYLENGFINQKTRKADAWQLYRFVKELYKDKYHSYTSPHRRRRKDFVPYSKGK